MPNPKCQHYFCQCMRANELAVMGRLEEAVQLHQQNEHVMCRETTKEPFVIDVIINEDFIPTEA